MKKIDDIYQVISEEDYWKPTPKGIFNGRKLNDKEIKECVRKIEESLKPRTGA